jgi:hypothetical protein
MPDVYRPKGLLAIFCSYSHKDEQYREQFEAHVAVMKRQNLIQIWQDRKILAGNDWLGEIDSNLNDANIVALLVSSDFLNSDYCYDKEMQRAMERHANEHIPVIPIIVRPCDWQEALFGRLQAIPLNGKAVTLWENIDEAWTDVANRLKLTVKALLEQVQQKLREQEERSLPVEKSGAFIFRDDNPERIAEEKQKAYEWVMENRSERSDTLQQMEQKIAVIDRDVMTGTTEQQQDSYRKWEEYIRRV